jgi:hypothetical protein
MPSLAQMFSQCQKDSYFSRSDDEIWAALDRAGRRVYNAVCNENGGFFIKFDTTSVSIVANTNEYALPADAGQLVYLAERTVSTDQWREIQPDTIRNVLFDQLVDTGILSLPFYPASKFTYYGPYLDTTNTALAGSAQAEKIRLSPSPGESHFCQCVYTARWLQILNASSSLMLPDEGTPAMERFAAAALVRKNSDSLANEFEDEGRVELISFLTWARARQIQKGIQVTPYMDGE